jgi:hypothetical protein
MKNAKETLTIEIPYPAQMFRAPKINMRLKNTIATM